MMSKILKVNNKESLRGAIDLGIAMQLTNMLEMYVKIKNVIGIYKSDFSSIKETYMSLKFFIKNLLNL